MKKGELVKVFSTRQLKRGQEIKVFEKYQLAGVGKVQKSLGVNNYQVLIVAAGAATGQELAGAV